MTPDTPKSREDVPENIAALVAQFSHDVASPLTLVLALSELLLQTTDPGDRAHDDLTHIHAAAREALTMVRSLAARVAAQDHGSSAPGS